MPLAWKRPIWGNQPQRGMDRERNIGEHKHQKSAPQAHQSRNASDWLTPISLFRNPTRNHARSNNRLFNRSYTQPKRITSSTTTVKSHSKTHIPKLSTSKHSACVAYPIGHIIDHRFDHSMAGKSSKGKLPSVQAVELASATHNPEDNKILILLVGSF